LIVIHDSWELYVKNNWVGGRITYSWNGSGNSSSNSCLGSCHRTLCLHTNKKCKLKPCNSDIEKFANSLMTIILNHIECFYTLKVYITMRAALGHGQLLIQRSQASTLKRRISSNTSLGHLQKFDGTNKS